MMLLFFLHQPEAKALLILVISIVILLITCSWAWIISNLTYVILYFVLVILLMRWFARGGQYSEIDRLDLNELTFLITGAAGGIGKETAIELAKRGARIILFARSSNLARAIDDVKRVARSPKNVTGYPLDLADLRSIKSCVEQFMKNEDR